MAEPVTVDIDCGEEITPDDIQRLKNEVTDERYSAYIDAANALVCKTPSWVLRDAEIFITLPHQHYTLHAGEKTNKYAIFYDDETGKVETVRKDCGWWLYLKETTANTFEWVTKNIPLSSLLLLIFGKLLAIKSS
ncbi:uncharacterized protein LOC117109018 [Anneissia japonica]|uniref:uncharacterized protein LOC117109018 n=1 Tax=Anneissia japonica TaxID=1529436 RepID=UPI001425B6B2|nr:uncharacterized protein LOC117109018 [Anneissia japonica]XP_033107133.1 uncharacterized protein LOC117109018 [Anneissia japonica]